MSFYNLLASDPNVSEDLKRAFCEATHTIPAHQIRGTPEWQALQDERWDQDRADHLRDLARERAQRRDI